MDTFDDHAPTSTPEQDAAATSAALLLGRAANAAESATALPPYLRRPVAECLWSAAIDAEETGPDRYAVRLAQALLDAPLRPTTDVGLELATHDQLRDEVRVQDERIHRLRHALSIIAADPAGSAGVARVALGVDGLPPPRPVSVEQLAAAEARLRSGVEASEDIHRLTLALDVARNWIRRAESLNPSVHLANADGAHWPDCPGCHVALALGADVEPPASWALGEPSTPSLLVVAEAYAEHWEREATAARVERDEARDAIAAALVDDFVPYDPGTLRTAAETLVARYRQLWGAVQEMARDSGRRHAAAVEQSLRDGAAAGSNAQSPTGADGLAGVRCDRGVAGDFCARPPGHDGSCNPTVRIAARMVAAPAVRVSDGPAGSGACTGDPCASESVSGAARREAVAAVQDLLSLPQREPSGLAQSIADGRRAAEELALVEAYQRGYRQSRRDAANELYQWAAQVIREPARGGQSPTHKRRTIRTAAERIAPESTDEEMRQALVGLLGGMGQRARGGESTGGEGRG